VEEDRGDAAQRLSLAHVLEVLEQLRHRHAELGGGRRERLRHRLHRPLRGTDRGEVELRQRDRLGLLVVHGLGGRG
jgi:hypothetical protein